MSTSTETRRPSLTSTRPPGKRACDQCHGQKLACTGTQPCSRCSKLLRACTYDNPRRTKGPTPRARFSRDSRDGRYDPMRRRSDSQAEPTSTSPGSSLRNPWVDGQTPAGHYNEMLVPIHPVANSVTAPIMWHEDEYTGWTAEPVETSFMDLISSASSAMANLPSPTTQFLTYQSPDNAVAGPSMPAPSPPVSTAIETTTSAMQDAWLERIISRPEPTIDSVLDNEQFTLSLLAETLFRPQITSYFDRINPMMPVLERSDILARLDDPEWLSARDNLALVLVTTGLALVHPFTTEEKSRKSDRERQALMLLDRACRLVAAWDYGCVGTVEKTLTSFVSFGILHELGHGGGARLRLRDAISMAESMGLNRRSSYDGLEPWEARRRLRLFYILALTERAYALQRPSGGPLAFQGEISGLARNVLTMHSEADDEDPVSLSLHHLSGLFSYIDKNLVACWNGTCNTTTCSALDVATILQILVKLNGRAEDVFPSRRGLHTLTEAQRADLLVTWQWIKSRMWMLASLHGLTNEYGPSELSSVYVLDTALRLVEICNELSFGAMECHGTGFAEKLYDVAHLTANVVATLPPIAVSSDHARVNSNELGIEAAQTLQMYVARHHRGRSALGPKLQEAITQARMVHNLAAIM